MEDSYTGAIARSEGYREQLIDLISTLEVAFPDGCDISWCYVDEALEKHCSEAEVLKLALNAPHNAFLSDPVHNPEPTLEELISDGEKLYARHCNPDGSFRYEDFDTPEKIEAFRKEREELD